VLAHFFVTPETLVCIFGMPAVLKEAGGLQTCHC
jgi:hypothetical protein